MSYKDNRDLRVRTSGYFWGEEELLTSFAKFIGPHGVAVYIALTRLIPLAGCQPDRYSVTARTVAAWSSVPRSTCAEIMDVLMKSGMVIKTVYLDGREPSYQLPSLRDLDKMGMAELKRCFGVRAADTAPFDQEAKNLREKELRKKKRGADAGTRVEKEGLPFGDAETELPESIRAADTIDREDVDLQAASDGVRGADTAVSGKSVTVSEKHVTVSGKTVNVSENPGPVLKSLKTEEKGLKPSPLPPAERGDVGPVDPDDPDAARPNLPAPNATISDDGFAQGLPIAATWLMVDVGVSDRRMRPAIEAQLTLYCKKNKTTSLVDAVAFMARQSRLLHEHAHLLEHRPWGWQKWFTHGHWCKPLPYVSASMGRDAIVGMNREQADEKLEQEAAAGAFEQERCARFIAENAVAIEQVTALPGAAEFARRLRALDVAETPLDKLDRVLSAIEAEIEADLLANAGEEILGRVRRQAEEQIQPYRERVPKQELPRIMKQVVLKRLFDELKIPRLGLYYMR